MSIPRYRIGNDLSVLWAVNNRDGSPYNLDGKEVHLFVTNDRGRYKVPVIIETLEDGTTNNVVRWDFRGEQQRVLGTYTLTLEITNTADSKEIKRDKSEAFSLVCCSESESIEDGEPNIQDGGELILATKLDIYRFGVAKIEIGVNGNWFIDGVDTGRPSFAGEGLVNKIYRITDFGGTFTEDSKIDTFNAYAINSLFLGVSKAAEDIADLYTRLEDVIVGGGGGGSCLWRVDAAGNLWTDRNVYSTKEISAKGLNLGPGGEGGASPDLSVLNNYLLKTEAAELYLVKDAAKDFASVSSVTDLSKALAQLSKTYGNRLNALEKIVQWFHLTQDEQAIYTEKNFYSEKEISAHGLNLGGGSGEGGTIELGNIIGVSLHSPVTGDVFVYNGTHWTNISQSELVPDLSGYATTDSVSTVSNKVKSLEDRLNDLESEKFFFKLEGADDVIYTPYNLFSEKEISAHGLNYGSGSGASGLLTDLLDVKAEDSTRGDLLVFDGTHWINTPQSAIVPSIDTSVIATRDWVGQNYASTSDLSNGVKDAKAYTDALRRHVNEQDQILSGQISKILDWFTLEDGVLLTKYNLASEKEVSAKGINASQGGGTSYNRLDSWSAYDSSKAGYVLSALLGYDLHSRVTTLENAEVDLSDYYTKSQTNSQIASAIGAIDLSPYATKEALNTLEGKHNTLRSEFDALNNLLSSDTEDYINTWNEVVAFLDGYKDESDLATILSGMNGDIASRLLTSDFESWKTNTFTPHANLVANHTTRLDGLDQSILSINTRIDGVDKTIEDHIAEFIAFRANFEISDNLILVRKNFASTEEVSAKGINQGTGGGGGSSYSRLDTWEGYDNNKAGYVLSAGLGYGLKVAIDELNGYDLDNRVRSIENSYISKDAGGVINGGLVVSSLAVAGGSSSQFLKADGSLDGTSYLSTAGGMMKGDVTLPLDYYLRVEDSYEGYAMLGHNDSGILVGTPNIPLLLRSNGVATINGNTLLHSGNIGSYNAGGLVEEFLDDLNNATGGRFFISNFQAANRPNEGVNYGTGVTFKYSDIGAIYQLAYDTYGGLYSRYKVNSWSNWKTIAFTDSDITGNAAGLMTGASHLYAQYNDTDKYIVFGYQTARNGYSTTIDGTSITFRDGGSNPTMLINSAGNVTIGGSDLADSGEKLHVAGRVRSKAIGINRESDNAEAFFLMPKSNNELQFQATGGSGFFSFHTAYNGMGERMRIANNGNVGIGTANPQYKLDVAGDVGITSTNGYLDLVNGQVIGNATLTIGVNGTSYAQIQTSHYGVAYTCPLCINSNGGNVGIGTTDPSETLDVNGNTRVRGDIVTNRIIIGGVTLSTEDGVLKIESDMYATGEISAHGLNKGESGGGGSSYSRLDTWIGYDSSKAGYVLSAGLGYDLKLAVDELNGYNLNSRLTTVESNYLSKNGGVATNLTVYGGTINGDFIIDRSISTILYYKDGVRLGFMGFRDELEPIIYDAAGHYSYDILHTGNIASYAITPSTIGSQSVNYAAYAKYLSAYQLTDITNLDGTAWYDWGNQLGDSFNTYTYGILLRSLDTNIFTRIAGCYSDASLRVRRFAYGTDSGWKQLAFLDDNVASATKLETPRTIWGQSFDGTGNVGGDLSDVTFLTIRDYDYGIYKGNYFGGLAASDIVFTAPNLYFYTSNFSMLINSSGNVTIGATDLASSSHRLYVDGAARFVEITDTSAINHYDSGKGYFVGLRNFGLGVTTGGLLLYTYGATPMSFYTNGGERMRITASGNVGIGIDYPQYKLHVNGDGGFSSNLNIGGHLFSSLSDFYMFYDSSKVFLQAGPTGVFLGEGTQDTTYLSLHGKYIRMVTNGVEKMRITEDGTVRIDGSLSAGATTLSSLTVSGTTSLSFVNVSNEIKVDGGYGFFRKDISGNIADIFSYQHSLPIEIGRKSNDMCIAMGVTADDYAVIQSKGIGITNTGKLSINPQGGDIYLGGVTWGQSTYTPAVTIANDGNVSIVKDLSVSGLSTFTGGVVAYDIHGNGQSLYLGNASNNAFIKVREDMVGSTSMWSIPRDGKATFTSLTTPTLSVTGSATIASVTIDAGNATLSNLTVNTVATLKQLVVGIDGMSCNGPATFNDFIYGSSITPRTDNYYVLGNNNYKWYAVTAYNVNVHDAITIEAGKELRFKDNNGVVHSLRYDSDKQAFVFDGNVNATGEMSAKKLNA